MTKIDELMRQITALWATKDPTGGDLVAIRQTLEAALKLDHSNDSDAWKHAALEDGDDVVLRCLAKAYRFARNGVGQNIGQYRALIDSAIEAAQKPGEFGEADVWHEGSHSFYRANLMHKLEEVESDHKHKTTVPPRLTGRQIADYWEMPMNDMSDFARTIETAVRKQFGVNDE